jgi:hypothetical protein
MLEENIWLQLNEEEKFAELQSYLQAVIAIEQGKHELSHTSEQGRLPGIKKELHEKIFKIIELENAV